MKSEFNYKNIIAYVIFFFALGCLPIYDHHRVITDFYCLKAFLKEARFSSFYDRKNLIVRVGEKKAELCTGNGKTIKILMVPTLYQVNYDTTIGKGMIVFTPHGTNQYNVRIHGGDVRLRSWLGFKKSIAVNCNGFVSEGVYPEKN